MNLTELLRQTNSRVGLDNRWLVFDATENEWFVYEHKYAQRDSTCLYRGGDLVIAIAVLVGGGD